MLAAYLYSLKSISGAEWASRAIPFPLNDGEDLDICLFSFSNKRLLLSIGPSLAVTRHEDLAS